MSFTFPKVVHVPFEWRTITASNQEDWPFRPDAKILPNLSALMRGPKVYRFYFHPGTGTTACYIGESERFERRVRQYIRALAIMRLSGRLRDSTLEDLENAMKSLNRHSKVRVAAKIVNAEIDNSKVELQLLDFDEFAFNRVSISPDTLTDPFHRRAIENLAILEANSSSMTLMNRGRDLAAKDFSRLHAKRAPRVRLHK
jgi:hypothetical protein